MCILLRCAAIAVVVLSSFPCFGQMFSFRKNQKAPEYVPGQVLIRFRPGRSVSAKLSAHARVQGSVRRQYTVVPELQLVNFPVAVSVETALAAYRSDPNVLHAEPNYIRRATQSPATPNDPMFGDLWGLHNAGSGGGRAGADIKALEAWAVSTGDKNVVVAVIDTGIDYQHPDLAANIWNNTSDCDNNGIDDDGDGYADDCHGIDLVNHDSDPMDDNSHGTHVAGTIGAVGNNNLGVVGVNWTTTIIGCKFLSASGYGSDADAIGCLDWLAKLKQRGVNIVATNNSWGGSGFGQALREAIQRHRDLGILFIAAAGNASSDNDAEDFYPASYGLENIISVAATTRTDTLTEFSNFGRHTVHIGAPGQEIQSTVPGNRYGMKGGTSMASPHVTGAVALLAAAHPELKWWELKNRILSSGDIIPSLQSTITGRRLNVNSALNCSNSEVLSLLSPHQQLSLASAGRPFVFTALHVKCESPAGAVTVDVGNENVTLADDGQNGDLIAGDGLYSGAWTPSAPGVYTFTMAGESRTVIVDPYTPTSVAMDWRDISSAGDGLSLGNGRPGMPVFLDLPFPLSFTGRGLYAIAVSQNGTIAAPPAWMSFAPSSPLPVGDTDLLLSPFGELLYADGLLNQRNVFWGVLGQAPSRELVIEWRNMPHSACPATTDGGVSFQVVFFEDKTDVLYNYQSVAFGGACAMHDNGATASIGLQAGRGSAVQYSFQQPKIAAHTAMLWKLNPDFPQNPAPTLSFISPRYHVATTYYSLVTAAANGSNFINQSLFLVDGEPRWVIPVKPTNVTVVLMGKDIAQPHMAKVEMFNPLPGGGRSQPLDYEIKAQDFRLALSTSTVDLTLSTSGSTTVTVQPAPALIDPIDLSCTTSDPRLTCNFTNARMYGEFERWSSTALNIQRTGSASASVTIPVIPRSPRPSRTPGAALLASAFLAVLGFVQVRGSRRRVAAMLVVVLFLAATQFACGGGGGSHEPPPLPPTAALTAAPSTIGTGQSSLLSWSTSNATTVTLAGETVAANGTKTVSPAATSTYHLVAQGAGGTKEATATVTVINTTTATVTVTVRAAGIERTATVTVTLPA